MFGKNLKIRRVQGVYQDTFASINTSNSLNRVSILSRDARNTFDDYLYRQQV